MYQMVVLVLDDLNKSEAIFDAWQRVGVTGITIWQSTGIGRARAVGGVRDDLPLLPSLRSLLQAREEPHMTIMTLVDDTALVDELIIVTDTIIGGLDGPNKGIMVVLPVMRALGVAQTSPGKKETGP